MPLRNVLEMHMQIPLVWHRNASTHPCLAKCTKLLLVGDLVRALDTAPTSEEQLQGEAGRAWFAESARRHMHAVFCRPAVVLERLRELASHISPAWLDTVGAAVAEAAQSGE